MKVFIGLVTYPGSTFADSTGERGLARSVRAGLESQGVEVTLSIHDSNIWNPLLLEIDKQEIEKSIDAELNAEFRWKSFLRGRRLGLPHSLVMTVRRLYRRWRLLPGGASLGEDHPGFCMVRRLVNIENAHAQLLRDALKSGAEWALILEDDAQGDSEKVVESLMSVIRNPVPPKFVNFSDSFHNKKLGIEHLLSYHAPTSEDKHFHAFAAERPVTNTVCAILYRTTFVEVLLSTMDSMPLSPVIPIDWKLNEVLMMLSYSGELQSGDCWILRPAPVSQGSMHV